MRSEKKRKGFGGGQAGFSFTPNIPPDAILRGEWHCKVFGYQDFTFSVSSRLFSPSDLGFIKLRSGREVSIS